ncbi:sigma 54-interacting transcriptional regulator [Clostridium sp. DL1XJH146]
MERKVIINYQKGIHARVAAMIIKKAIEIKKKYNVDIFISNDIKRISATCLMPLITMKIKKDNQLIVTTIGNDDQRALEEFCLFIESDFEMKDKETMNIVDNILQDNAITWEQVSNSIENGIIVIDNNNIITVFNPAAEKMTGISAENAVGRKIYKVIANTRLHIVNKTRKSELNRKEKFGNNIFLTNRSPIIVDNELKGAVAVFINISSLEKITYELNEVKELKERNQLILESVGDGICVINKEGIIIYVNKAYLNILNIEEIEIIDKNIRDISPNGARMKVLKTGIPIIGEIRKKCNNITVVANVNPIKVDGSISGVISVVKNINEVKYLSDKLHKISAKAEYLEEQLIRTKQPFETFSKFIGKSGKAIDTLAIATKAAKVKSSILIRGESGTGKELIAEAIHYSSNRRNNSFIRVNCAAIPSNLLESELFGHEKGSFTGAIKKKLGKFELANKGTIFLDEIGEMDFSMQAKLLRVLQQKEFERVGGEETLHIDVRIVAATNKNLEQMCKEGTFREDLYYRLNVVPIIIPPLRERNSDIPLLIEYFIDKKSKAMSKNIKGIKKEAMEILIEYKWPGNVRELENIIERILTLTENLYIDIDDLPIYIKQNKLNYNNNFKYQWDNKFGDIINNERILTLSEYEKVIIKKALEKYNSFNAAGKALGISHKTVAAKARKYGIVNGK